MTVNIRNVGLAKDLLDFLNKLLNRCFLYKIRQQMIIQILRDRTMTT